MGCKQLWGQLLGRETVKQHIVTTFDSSRDVCDYFDNNSEQLSYQLSSGRVIFLTKD